MFSITQNNERLGRRVYAFDVDYITQTDLGCCSVIIDSFGGGTFLVVSASEIFDTNDFPMYYWRSILKVTETVNDYFYKKNNILLKELIIPQFLPVRQDEEETVIHKIRSMGILPKLENSCDIQAVPCVRRVISLILKNLWGKTTKVTTKEGLLDKEKMLEVWMNIDLSPINKKAIITKLRRCMIKYNEHTFFKDELGNDHTPAEFILEGNKKPIDLPKRNKWVIEL